MTDSIPFIKLSGGPEQIGKEFGTRFRERIQACYQFYTRELFADPYFDFQGQGQAYFEIIDRYFPEYALEMGAMARAAGLEPWQIAVLNARSEIFIKANADQITECTSLFFPKSKLLGQNWDWMRPCENFMVLVEIQRENGHKFITMTEAGILSKIGFNSQGLGVCLNILFGTNPTFGIPIHILLRAALDSPSMSDFQTLLQSIDFGCYSSILMADAEGRSLTMEFEGNRLHFVDHGQGIPKHTNHYLYEHRDDPSLDHVANSLFRLKQAKELEARLEPTSRDSMLQILWSRDQGEDSICKAYAPLWHLEHGTICTILMDLAQKTMYITDGNPYDAQFQFRQLKL